MTKLTSTKEALNRYLRANPNQESAFVWLRAAIESGVDVFDRKTTPGHVTVGVIAYSKDQNAVLHIHHKALDKWLLPGGHVESLDDSLESAALRELQEETGIRASGSLTLLEINRHEIPANPIKNEPSHDHYDFRYLVQVSARERIDLQEEEVLAYRWIPLADVRQELANRIGQYL